MSSVSAFGATGSKAGIKYNGKYLYDIPDILRETGFDLEIGKKSLLFVERVPVNEKGVKPSGRSSNSYYQGHVFKFNTDGTLKKQYDMPAIENIGPVMYDHTQGYAIKPLPFFRLANL